MSVKDELVCPSCESPAEKAEGATSSESGVARYKCSSCGYVWWEAEDTLYKNEFFNEIIEFFQQELDAAKKGNIKHYEEGEAKKLLEMAKGRDLDMLSNEWAYLVKTDDGNYYWTNKKDDYARII